MPPGGQPWGGWQSPQPPPPPPPPGSPGNAAAVALLNLSGLGLGYLALRRWPETVVCWVAIAALALVAFPADADGISGALVAGYGVLLVLAALDGFRRGLKVAARLPVTPAVAVGVAVALLAVPAGSAFGYEQARQEASEQALLKRLAEADRLVKSVSGQPYGSAQGTYGKALEIYEDLGENHSGSRAADRVPARVDAYYEQISAPYREGKHCDALAPLKHLRTVPDKLDGDLLGKRKGWADGPLATSLLECGRGKIGTGETPELAELLTDFPDSEQAGQVKPAFDAAVAERAKAVGGAEPCAATDQLRKIGEAAKSLPGGVTVDVARPVENGTYACGVDQFKDKDFEESAKTLKAFASDYKKSPRRARAKQIAIAAEIAAARPQAGRGLPREKAPGGTRMSIEITNGGPGAVTVLYTGPVTGTLTLGACGSCKTYSSESEGRSKACKAGGPKKTLRLPAGDYHFLYKRADTGDDPIRDHTAGSHIQPGYTYTDCLYVVSGFSGLGDGGTDA
ncbi:hypothetical protein AB0M28_34830 [Streptomyces sp. NPDC051940]|uniref:hypothetical protein n=1 Tax=Streptomyces sp. NPDC051940 TaxID=3155675 RepID=UPI003416DD8D